MAVVSLRLALFLIPAVSALAQSVRVYSEFQRIDPFGNIIAADRAEEPREILSPALARNAWTSFQVALGVPAGGTPKLYIGQNPENSVKVELYKAVFVKSGESWIPNGLAPVSIAGDGLVAGVAPQVPGQTTLVYWLDLWVDNDAPVWRTRLEVQFNAGDHWIIYPMELRVQTARVPEPSGRLEAVAPVEAPSSDSARATLGAYVCGAGSAGDEGPLTIRRMIRRNARQDIAIARSLEPGLGKAAVLTELLNGIGARDRSAWCKAPGGPAQLGAEWYLRVRDFLYRMANHPGVPEVTSPWVTTTPAP
jgi:hypothetical protein